MAARGTRRVRSRARAAGEDSKRASVAIGRGLRASVRDKTGRGGICRSRPPAMKYARTSAAAQSQGRRTGEDVAATASASRRSWVGCSPGRVRRSACTRGA
eukprot:5008119-Pleurochrysis_carterae.AAC.2